MKYLSVCSGIEAATVAWHPLDWEPVAFAEIDPFASAVLRHHYPGVPNLGDFTRIDGVGPVDLLVGGTPCQSFSVAGLRGGLADPRGNLALEYLRLLDRARARWCVWENVPGVLSSGGGRDFGAVLGGLAELGYGFAYRVLDAQHAGVPQRRRRVFVVGHLGDWRRAAAVLFERHSLQGHSPPRKEAGQRVADSLTVGANQCSGTRTDFVEVAGRAVAGGLTARYGKGPDSDLTDALVTVDDVHPALAASTGGPASQDWRVHAAVLSFDSTWSGDYGVHEDEVGSLRDGNGTVPAVAFHEDQRTGAVYENDHTHARAAGGGGKPGQGYQAVREGMAVRRLTPRECERLQGFPDDFTLVPYRGKPAADGPRYRALGNSMAVPCMAWIGRRIQMVEEVA